MDEMRFTQNVSHFAFRDFTLSFAFLYAAGTNLPNGRDLPAGYHSLHQSSCIFLYKPAPFFGPSCSPTFPFLTLAPSLLLTYLRFKCKHVMSPHPTHAHKHIKPTPPPIQTHTTGHSRQLDLFPSALITILISKAVRMSNLTAYG